MRGVREGSRLAGIVYATLVSAVSSFGTAKESYAVEEPKKNPIAVTDAGALNIETYLGNLIYDSNLADAAKGQPSASGDTLTWNGDNLRVSRTGCAPSAPVSYSITRTIEGSGLEARINATPNVHYDPGISRADLEKRYDYISDNNERERLIAEHLTPAVYDASVTVSPITINGDAKGVLILSVQGNRTGEYTLTRRIRDNSEEAHVKESSETIKANASDADNLRVVYIHLEGLFHK